MSYFIYLCRRKSIKIKNRNIMEFYARVKTGIFENCTFIGKELQDGRIKDVWTTGRSFEAENVEVLFTELVKDLTPFQFRFKRSYLTGKHKISFKDGYIEIRKPKGKKVICRFDWNANTDKLLKE